MWASAMCVTRSAKVRGSPSGLNLKSASGMLSRCIQHEMDHLDGLLLVDHLTAVRRHMILRKLEKARKATRVPA